MTAAAIVKGSRLRPVVEQPAKEIEGAPYETERYVR
jgi:hypothetical protein